MLTLDEAKAIVERYASDAGADWIPGSDILERDSYWFFPVGYIGSSGVVVDKASGELVPLGSAFELDDWLWGYENGFLRTSVTLRVISIDDFDRTLAVLQGAISAKFRWRYELRNWLKERLRELPADFPHQDLALSIPTFRAALRSGWFTFELADC